MGVSPDKGAAFFERLIARDDGWLASYFDALARIRGPVRDYLTDPARMKRFYTAVRGRVTSPGPARPVFRSNTDMMLLTTRLRLDADGKPHIPGSLEVWKNLFVNHPHGKYDGKLTKAATSWKEPDDVLEALFALCRKAVENEPLKIFMAMSDLDRNRATPLDAGDGGPPGARVPAVTARSTRSSTTPRRSATSRSCSSWTRRMPSTSIKDRHAARRRGRNDAGAGGPLADLVRATAAFRRRRRTRAFAALLAPFAEMRNNRDLFDAGRSGREGAARGGRRQARRSRRSG